MSWLDKARRLQESVCDPSLPATPRGIAELDKRRMERDEWAGRSLPKLIALVDFIKATSCDCEHCDRTEKRQLLAALDAEADS